MHDDDRPPGGYASALVSVALASGFFAFWVIAVCLWSVYREALEPSFICDAYNCVLDGRTWFERQPGAWSLGLGLVAICGVSILINRRQPIDR